MPYPRGCRRRLAARWSTPCSPRSLALSALHALRARSGLWAPPACQPHRARHQSGATPSMVGEDAARVPPRRAHRRAAVPRSAHGECLQRPRQAVARVAGLVLFGAAQPDRATVCNGAQVSAGRTPAGHRKGAGSQRPSRWQGSAARLRAGAAAAVSLPSLDGRMESAAHAGGNHAPLVGPMALLFRSVAQER